MTPDDHVRGRLHGVGVEGAVDEPGVLAADGSTVLAVQDMVTIHFAAGVETGVEGLGYLRAGANGDVGGQQAVQPLEENLRGEARVGVEICRLPQRVHPGIGAPRAEDRSRAPGHAGDCAFHLGLHRAVLGLALPPAVGRAVVFQGELEIGHRGHPASPLT